MPLVLLLFLSLVPRRVTSAPSANATSAQNPTHNPTVSLPRPLTPEPSHRPADPVHRQIRHILAEADENDDDVIQYKEFLPIMIDILQSIKVREPTAHTDPYVRGSHSSSGTAQSCPSSALLSHRKRFNLLFPCCLPSEPTTHPVCTFTQLVHPSPRPRPASLLGQGARQGHDARRGDYGAHGG